MSLELFVSCKAL